jgi:hypothetical protein
MQVKACKVDLPVNGKRQGKAGILLGCSEHNISQFFLSISGRAWVLHLLNEQMSLKMTIQASSGQLMSLTAGNLLSTSTSTLYTKHEAIQNGHLPLNRVDTLWQLAKIFSKSIH